MRELFPILCYYILLTNTATDMDIMMWVKNNGSNVNKNLNLFLTTHIQDVAWLNLKTCDRNDLQISQQQTIPISGSEWYVKFRMQREKDLSNIWLRCKRNWNNTDTAHWPQTIWIKQSGCGTPGDWRHRYQ